MAKNKHTSDASTGVQRTHLAAGVFASFCSMPKVPHVVKMPHWPRSLVAVVNYSIGPTNSGQPLMFWELLKRSKAVKTVEGRTNS